MRRPSSQSMEVAGLSCRRWAKTAPMMMFLLIVLLPHQQNHGFVDALSGSQIAHHMSWTELNRQTPVRPQQQQLQGDVSDNTLSWLPWLPSSSSMQGMLRDEIAQQVLKCHQNKYCSLVSLEFSIDKLLQDNLGGVWVSGWSWSNGENGAGGPVSDRYYCCPQHSLALQIKQHRLSSGFQGPNQMPMDYDFVVRLLERQREHSWKKRLPPPLPTLPEDVDDETRIATLLSYEVADDVLGAVCEWYDFVNDLRQVYADGNGQEKGMDDEERIEAMAVRLLPLILRRTEHSDAWYGTFVSTLLWGAEAQGIYQPSTKHKDQDAISWTLFDRVIRGRFESWSKPSVEHQAEVCSSVGHYIVEHQKQTQLKKGSKGNKSKAKKNAQKQRSKVNKQDSIDALTPWLAIRDSMIGRPLPEDVRRSLAAEWSGRFGPHEVYIETFDRRRAEETNDETRVLRMRWALHEARILADIEQCDHSAEAPSFLEFEDLQQLQQLVLDKTELPAFRSGDAYAKGGRERYPFDEGTLDKFRACLKEGTMTIVDPCEDRALHFWKVIQQAARLYLDILFFHPFKDGNSRVARLAMDYVLTKHKLWLGASDAVFAISRSATDQDGLAMMAVTLGLSVDPRDPK